MNSGKEVEKNENVFIGARVLGEDGVKLVLPTYDVLISQIEQMKYVARNSEKQNSNISRIMKYNREHNNTIAIFGSRGTGKTSAVYTLMDYLLNQNDSNKKEKNIVLPIIEPDNFGDNTKIMGSIVGLIKNEVEEILKEVKCLENKTEPYFRNCIYVENNPLKQKMDELLEHHMYSDSEYRNIITHNYTDTATHIKKSSHLLIPDINLKHKFWDVIDEIVRLYKNKLDKDAIIYIFIDDIDLKTTKCKELIEAIMQYSSHPNVITILSGDYELLEEGVMLSLIGDENLREKGLDVDFILKNNIESKNELLNLDKTKIHIENSNVNTININESIETGLSIKDRKLDLAENYLKKIIPPSRRHHVVDWNIENIPSFSFGKTKLIDKIYEFYNGDNIFGFKDSNSNICSTKYPYIIFDTAPRGLINVYYNLNRIVKNDKKSFFDIKLLIDTIIDASPYLLKNKEEFYKFINWGSDFKSTKINYDKLIIEGSENRSLKEALSYFIIAEMLLYYEKDISDNGIYYEKDKYDEAKKDIIIALYYNSSIDSLYKGDTKYKLYRKQNNLYYKNLYDISITFALNIDFMDSLRFLNILLESEFGCKYGYEYFPSDSIVNKKKNENFINCIYYYINLDLKNKKEILKKMRIYANENSNNENKKYAESINDFLNFLYNTASISNLDNNLKEKYIDVEKYEGILGLNNNQKLSEKLNDILNTPEENIYKIEWFKSIELNDIIFLNLIRNIDEKKTDLGYKTIEDIKAEYEIDDKYIKNIKGLDSKTKNKEQMELEEYNKLKNKIEEFKKRVIVDFLSKIKDKEKEYFRVDKALMSIQNDNFYTALCDFAKAEHGSIGTNYSVVKNKIKNKFLEYNIEIKDIVKIEDNILNNILEIEKYILKNSIQLKDYIKENITLEMLCKKEFKLSEIFEFEKNIKLEDLLNESIESEKIFKSKLNLKEISEGLNGKENILKFESLLKSNILEIITILKDNIELDEIELKTINFKNMFKKEIVKKLESGISLETILVKFDGSDILNDEVELQHIFNEKISLKSIFKDNELKRAVSLNKLFNLDYEVKFDDIIKNTDILLFMYYKIKELSEDNRAWYGKQEARAFLDVLNSSVSIDLEKEDIKKYVPLLYYIGKFNEIINPELREGIEFEDIKEKMKKLLDDVDRESMEEVIKEYEEFGLDIEDEYQEGL